MKLSLLLMASGILGIFHSSCGQASSQTQEPRNAIAAQKSVLDSLGAVSWQAVPGNKYYAAGSNEFYVYINLKGNEGLKNEKRVPLNISIVLDRSGSMGGDKIAYARQAANFVVDQLASDDIVSIVNYDDVVEVTAPSETVKNKEVLKRKIAALTARGSTNLTGGMLEGYAQAKTTRREGYVNRVLLMTDGLANAGITDPQQMKKLAGQKYMEEGIALSTFGLGADYNEDLLTMLAEMGRANYYFIGSADKIPAIFATELKGLLSVVAQNAWVQVDVPQGLECVKVYGYPYETANGKVTVRFNDVYANDQKGILLKFRAKNTLPENIAFNCSLSYVNAADFKTITSSKQLRMEVSSQAALVDEHRSLLVEEMIAVYESAEMFDEILAQVDAGRYDSAQLQADKAVTYLKTKQQYIRSDKLKKQEESMTVYSKDIEKVKTMRDEEKKVYQKTNKSSNYSIKKGRQ
jgi:Ca-activated chloride channel homolog